MHSRTLPHAHTQHENPFAFRHVTHLKHASQFDDVGPCVMMATPSGLQGGVSRVSGAQEIVCVRMHVCVCVCVWSQG